MNETERPTHRTEIVGDKKISLLRTLAAGTFSVLKYPGYRAKEVLTYDPHPDAKPTMSFHEFHLARQKDHE